MRFKQYCIPNSLEEIFNAEDDLGLFKGVKPARSQASGVRSSDDLSAFTEVSNFFRQYGREPEKGAAKVDEDILAARLETFRRDRSWAERVRAEGLDPYGLLDCAFAAGDGAAACAGSNASAAECGAVSSAGPGSAGLDASAASAAECGAAVPFTPECTDDPFIEEILSEKRQGSGKGADGIDMQAVAREIRLNSVPASLDELFAMDDEDDLHLLDDNFSEGSSASSCVLGVSGASYGSSASGISHGWYEEDECAGGSDIFELKHVRSYADRSADRLANEADEIGRRAVCTDFARYEDMFRKVHELIRIGEVELNLKSKPRENQIRSGMFFFLRGQVGFIDRQLGEERSGAVKKGMKRSENPRFRVIFDNGTEIDILKLSLAKAFYMEDSCRIDISDDLFRSSRVTLKRGEHAARNNPETTGWIYVLETLSEEPELARYKNAHRLVKIGCTRGESVEKRIANADKEPTYLFAPVKIIFKIECQNIDVRKFEGLIHLILDSERLKVKVYGPDGKSFKPEEWFTVTAETAADVARHIVDGTIMNYHLDSTAGKLKKN